MINNTLEKAFGDVPASFAAKVRETVAQMERQPQRVSRPRLAWVMAAIIVALAGTAFALSQPGVLDTLQQNLRDFLQPGASELVQTEVEQTAKQPEHASFTVEQAINDGHQVYATIRVRGDSDTLLIDSEADASWTTDWWEGSQNADTYSKRANDSHRRLVQASLFAVDSAGNMLVNSAPEIHYDGVDILYTLSFPAQSTSVSLQLFTYDVYADDAPPNERLSTGALSFAVPVTDARTFYAAETPIVFAHEQLTLTLLTVEQTPIATYMTCEYRAAEGSTDLTQLRIQDGIWAEWLNEQGEPVSEGQNANELEETDSGETRLVTVYRAFDALPDMVTLRFHDGMTGETLDTLSVALKRIEKEN